MTAGWAYSNQNVKKAFIWNGQVDMIHKLAPSFANFA